MREIVGGAAVLFIVALDFGELFSGSTKKVHFAALEELVLEVHVVSLFGEFGDFAELVHVELPDEGGEVLVSEEVG
jgi:hypothetical protein